MQQEFTYLPSSFYVPLMRVIILPLSHICVDFYLIFGVFILENIFIQRDGVDGYLSTFVASYMYKVGRGS